MPVSSALTDDGQRVKINVSGRFDFTSHQDFRKAYEQLEVNQGSYELDLGQTEYMDSSALGMLLMLREHAGGDTAKIRISNCHDEIRTVLAIANFHQLFQID